MRSPSTSSAHRGPLAVASRVSEALDHAAHGSARKPGEALSRAPPAISTLPIRSDYVNLANQVGAVPFSGERLGRDTCSLYVGVGSTLKPGTAHRVEPTQCTPHRRETPLDRLRPLHAQQLRERLRQVELAAGHRVAAVDDLREHLLALVLDVELDAARQHRVRDTDRRRRRSRRRTRSSAAACDGVYGAASAVYHAPAAPAGRGSCDACVIATASGDRDD